MDDAFLPAGDHDDAELERRGFTIAAEALARALGL